MMNRSIAIVGVVLLGMAVAGAQADIITTTKDTYLLAGTTHGDTNLGAGSSLWVRGGGSDWTVLLGGFDTSGLSGSIISANLYMWATSSGSNLDDTAVVIGRVTQSWTEGTAAGYSDPDDGATYNNYDGTNAWATAGGDYTDGLNRTVAFPAGTLMWATGVDVTTIVQYWISNPGSNEGLLIRSVDAVGSNRFSVASRERSSGAYTAYLDVVVPEPVTLSLLVLGGIGVLTRRKSLMS